MNEKPWSSVLGLAALLWASNGCLLFVTKYSSVSAVMTPWLVGLVLLLVLLVVVYRRENETSEYKVAPVAKIIHLIFGLFVAGVTFAKGWSLFRNGYWIAVLSLLFGLLFVGYAIAAGYYAYCDVARLRRGADERPKIPFLK